MEKQLSTPLLKRVRAALQAAKPPEIYWDQDQHLSAEQINKLLVLPDGLRQIEQEILEENEENIDQLTDELVREILGKYREEIAKELDLSVEDLTDEVLDLINHEYELYSNTPGIDPNVEQLIHRTRPRAVLQLGLYHDHEGWKWRETVEYKDVRKALRLFNVNPHKMHPKFPNLFYRNGNEYILPNDLLELWDNATYGGRYVMPIDLNLVEYQKNRDYYNTGIVLQKGSEIWMHHYGNGSGSISVPLQKDLTIRRKKLAYHISDDNDTAGYGLDTVYGLCQSAWDNTISPINTDNPVPYALPPYKEEFEHFMYGSVYAPWQCSTRVRAFVDKGMEHRGKSPVPGELLKWDITNYLWDSFPKSGKKFLQTKADQQADHLVFKIKETIGQALFVHCEFIVHDPSRKIVWSSVTESDRSQDVFEFIREKIQNTSSTYQSPDDNLSLDNSK